MSDLDHSVGSDLVIGSSGDLHSTTGPDWVRQRVLRRLLTNLGDYVWHLDYGGGLASFVGQAASQQTIEAAIRAQMLLEGSVARVPLPTVSVASSLDGTVTASVTFADNDTTGLQRATFPIGGN